MIADDGKCPTTRRRRTGKRNCEPWSNEPDDSELTSTAVLISISGIRTSDISGDRRPIHLINEDDDDTVAMHPAANIANSSNYFHLNFSVKYPKIQRLHHNGKNDVVTKFIYHQLIG